MRHNDISEQPSASVDRVLLTRVIAGEASPGDLVAVERWLAEDPKRGIELAELRRIWAWAGVLPSEAKLEGLWRDLHQRMHEAPAVQERASLRLLESPRRSRARRWTTLALAAAGIGAVAVGVGLNVNRATPVVMPAQAPERVYSTARGQRGVVELADGSRVQLGVDSRIRVRLYDGGRREVYLDGEAVFDVVHDERRPFQVYAGNAVTEDLGTRFGIRAYQGDSRVQVIVVSGKVALRPAPFDAARSAERGHVLGPRDLGEVGPAGEVHVYRGVDPDAYLAWTRGRLVFHEAPVADVAAWLERWYDIDIVIADSTVSHRSLTLELDVPSLDEALAAVAVPLGLQYKRTARRVTLFR